MFIHYFMIHEPILYYFTKKESLFQLYNLYYLRSSAMEYTSPVAVDSLPVEIVKKRISHGNINNFFL